MAAGQGVALSAFDKVQLIDQAADLARELTRAHDAGTAHDPGNGQFTGSGGGKRSSMTDEEHTAHEAKHLAGGHRQKAAAHREAAKTSKHFAKHHEEAAGKHDAAATGYESGAHEEGYRHGYEANKASAKEYLHSELS